MAGLCCAGILIASVFLWAWCAVCEVLLCIMPIYMPGFLRPPVKWSNYGASAIFCSLLFNSINLSRGIEGGSQESSGCSDVFRVILLTTQNLSWALVTYSWSGISNLSCQTSCLLCLQIEQILNRRVDRVLKLRLFSLWLFSPVNMCGELCVYWFPHNLKTVKLDLLVVVLLLYFLFGTTDFTGYRSPLFTENLSERARVNLKISLFLKFSWALWHLYF